MATERYNVTEYRLTGAETAELHGTSIEPGEPGASNGLTNEQAQQKMEEVGPNELPSGDQVPEIVKYLKEFLDPFMLMLVFAGVLSFAAYGAETPRDSLNLYLGGVLLGIVWLNSTISYLQQRSASNIMNQLQSLIPEDANVIRNGTAADIPVREVVPGDVVVLSSGDQVPADLRIIESNGLRLDASSITGESLPYECSVDPMDVDNLTDAKNLAFSSTICVEGRGVGIAIRTGGTTMIGSIARLTAATSSETTLQKETKRFVRIIGILAFAMAIVFFIIGVAQKRGVLDMFILAFVAVLVANIPQGLPATVTASLTVTAKRMRDRNVLVKRLDVVETVGAASVICSDKTGTLTTNVMTMSSVYYAGHSERLHGAVLRGPSHVNGRSQLHPVWRPRVSPLDAIFAPSDAPASNIVPEGEEGAGGGGAAADPEDVDAEIPKESSAEDDQALTRGSAERAHMLHTWYSAPFEPLLLIAALCNTATFAPDEDAEDEILSQLSHGPMHLSSFYGDKGVKRSKSRQGSSEVVDADGISRQASSNRRGPRAGYRTLEGAAGMSGSSKGNATDVAMMRYCSVLGRNDFLRDMYSQIAEVPFSSSRKYAAVLVRRPSYETGSGNGGPNVAYLLVKGAPERISGMCSRYLWDDGKSHKIDAEHNARVDRAYTEFASTGQRVLGFAMAAIELPPDGIAPVEELMDELSRGEKVMRNMTFLGMIALTDPPKQGVDRTIATCRRAGVRVFMVTGDHALTGGAIAREIGLLTATTRNDVAASKGVDPKEIPFSDPAVKAVVITGHEIEQLSEEEWDAILRKKEVVFARTTPEHKQEIVRRLGDMGEVVCVTGDGVNDAPALKEASVGVAMGSAQASDVAREAGDCILLDDNIASIVAACEEGRVLFSNLRKTIAYTLTNLEPEIFGVLLNLALQMPLGLTSLQILTLDLGTELLPAISFAYEQAEEDIMAVPPRTSDVHLVDRNVLLYSYGYAGVIESLGCFLSYVWAFERRGISTSDLPFTDDNWEDDSPPLELSSGEVIDGAAQERAANEARAAWYLGLVINQAFHRLAMRTSRQSAFTAMLSPNLIGDFGSVLAVAIGVIFVYVPAMHPVFQTDTIPVYLVVPSICSGLLLLLSTDAWKYYQRNYADVSADDH